MLPLARSVADSSFFFSYYSYYSCYPEEIPTTRQSPHSHSPNKFGRIRRLDMNLKKLATASSLLVIASFAWYVANMYRMANVVSSPQASIRQKVAMLFQNRNYQVAIPDRGILEEVRFSVVPRARACGGGGGGSDCDSTSLQAVCPLSCPTGYCYCGPGIIQSSCQSFLGCTPYYCQTTTNGRLTKLCQVGLNKDTRNCGPTCELDNLLSGCNVVMRCNGGQCP
jgi:hypothetical protein